MAVEAKIIRRPLRWRKIGDDMAIPRFHLLHGTAVVGEVFYVRKRGFHFKCFDGRDSALAGEKGWGRFELAKFACKAHIKGLSSSYQLPGICPKCGR